MLKKQLRNKLNSQNGMTSAEVIIALLVIITTLSVIAMIYTNLVFGSREIDRKTGATRIATNILENISMNYYDNLEEKLQELSDAGKITKVLSNETNNSVKYAIAGGQTDVQIFGTSVPSGYNVEITIKKIGDLDLVKEISLNVKYKVDGNDEKLSITKIIEREQVRECNSPRFDSEYLTQLNGLTTDNSIMSYENPEASNIDNIICPIKYNGVKYEIITEENELSQIWYSYSNKHWARVLILTSEEYAECQNDAEKISELLKDENNKSYIWIPRFGVENGGDISKDTYFKYKNTNSAIKNSYSTDENFIYNYIDNTIEWSENRQISFKENENELTGRWLPYSSINDETNNTLAYQLNISQYGPLIEY